MLEWKQEWLSSTSWYSNNAYYLWSDQYYVAPLANIQELILYLVLTVVIMQFIQKSRSFLNLFFVFCFKWKAIKKHAIDFYTRYYWNIILILWKCVWVKGRGVYVCVCVWYNIIAVVVYSVSRWRLEGEKILIDPEK